MKVSLTARAEHDFEAHVRWLHAHSSTAGRTAAVRIVEVIDLLAEFPELGTAVDGSAREKLVKFGRDGFVIRYVRTGSTLRILRIFHSRQDRPTLP